CRRHDANGAGDARAYEVVSALLSARLARWRAPPAPTH
ncbi:HNH endonuclease, partial [Xanthomonas citri pv. fuscans]